MDLPSEMNKNLDSITPMKINDENTKHRATERKKLPNSSGVQDLKYFALANHK